MRKIVFFDIDGTLVTEHNHATESTKQAVKALKDNEGLPVLATGRPPSMVKPVCEMFGIDSYIAMNGQYIVIQGEVVYANPLQTETVQQIVEKARADHRSVFLCGSDEIYGNALLSMMSRSNFFKAAKTFSQYIPRWWIYFVLKRFGRQPVAESLYEGKTIYQIVIQMTEEKDEDYRQLFPHCHFTRSSPISVDVVSKGTSKASAIQLMVKKLGMEMKDTIAFGDSLNDLEMLKEVEVGIAMGNARRELKEIADGVTAPVDEDGIMKGLRALRLIP